MKKIFILIALFAIPSFVFGQQQFLNMKERPVPNKAQALQIEAQALNTKASVLNKTFLNLSSISKYGDKLQDDILREIIDTSAWGNIYSGQPDEMGPQAHYMIDYDPYTNIVAGVAAELYGTGVTGQRRWINTLMIGVFRPDEHIDLAVYPLVDITSKSPDAGPVDVDTYSWADPSVVITNAKGTGNVEDVQIAASFRTSMTPRGTDANSTAPRYNTIYAFNGKGLLAVDGEDEGDSYWEEFGETVSYEHLEAPWLEELTNYTTIQPMKAHKAYFTDASQNKIPFAIFFSPIFNASAPVNNRLKFGILSLRMDKIPDVGLPNDINSIVHKFQYLPTEIEDLLGTGITITTTASTPNQVFRSFNVDYDNENNLYIGMLEKNAEFYDDVFRSDGFKDLPTPLVIKAAYDISELPEDGSVGTDMIQSFTPNRMPYSVLSDYIKAYQQEYEFEDEGGAIIKDVLYGSCDSMVENDLPGWGWYDAWRTADCPFIVTGPDSYSFFLPLVFVGRSREYVDNVTDIAQFVEISYSPASGWKITKVGDNEQFILAPGLSIASDYAHINIPGPNYNTLQPSYWTRYPHTKVSTGFTVVPEQQIARTADGRYLIAKWHHSAENEIIKLSEPANIWDNLQAPITIDSMRVTSLYLSYKDLEAAEPTWSEPVRASYLNYPKEGPEGYDPTRDTMCIMGSYMPRIVPDVNHVLISVARFVDQSEGANPSRGGIMQGLYADKILRHRITCYMASNLIAPSAITGARPVGIQEGEVAVDNRLESAFPNPATNTINFKFSLLKPAKTTLSIFNSLGQEVATIVNQYCDAREYNVDHNVSSLPVGTYYFTLTSGDVRQTKMFTIAR